MPRFLMSWEFGGALGHAARFKPIAQALQARGHHVDMALREIVHTRALLADLGIPVLQAPIWMHQTVGVPNPTISLSEILMGNGYMRADMLEALVHGWLSVMRLTRPDVVVADYAPTATLAARILGLPVATLSGGFSMPPDVSPLPAFRVWEPVAPGRLEHYDKHVLDVVNTVLTQHGAQPLSRLAQALHGDLPLLCSWPELDHYQRGELPPGQRWFGPNTLPAAGQHAPHWPEGAGPRVFAYLRATHPQHREALLALDQAGCRVLCYMPEVAAGQPHPVRSPRITYASGPVNLDEALPQSDLCVCHAGEATIAQSLLAGVPLLLMPMQAEQFLMAMRTEATGAALNAAARPGPAPYAAWIDALLRQPGHRAAAQAFGQRHAGFSREAQTQDIVSAMTSLLQPSA